MTPPTTYQAVRPYAARGWSIIPIEHGTKHNPTVYKGQKFSWRKYQDAPAPPEMIKEWFGGDDCFTEFAVILGPGSGRLACRDFDKADAYATWAEEYYEWASVLPTVKTSRGCHVYFRFPADTEYPPEAVIGYTDGELRLRNCICLLPPSRHPSGSAYEWIIPLPPGDVIEVNPFDIGMEGEGKIEKDEHGDIPKTFAEGQRHSGLLRLAGAMRRHGASPDVIATAIHKDNDERCFPPLPDKEVEDIARSMERYAPAGAPRQYVAVRMDQVPREPVFWIWKPWIPLGKLVILEGDPKVGKTTLALQFAAIISRGWAFPGMSTDDSEPRNTVILCAEDGLSDTLSHRLDHAEADSTRIWAMTAVRVREGAEPKDQMVTLADMDQLEQLIGDVSATSVIIDPIQSYIGSKINMDKANETRPVLQALGSMAQRRKCTPIILRHWRKSGGDALKGGMGSIDFNAAARSIMLAIRDPDDPRDKRVLAHTACNLAKEANSIGYSITEANGFMWGLEDHRSADDLCKLTTQGQGQVTKSAKNWLENFLRERGGTPATAVKASAKREGFSDWALTQARETLGVKPEKRGAIWTWGLPSE